MLHKMCAKALQDWALYWNDSYNIDEWMKYTYYLTYVLVFNIIS